MTCKVLNRNGKGFYTNVIKCIDYCSANGAKITSMSLGFATPNRGSTEALRCAPARPGAQPPQCP